MRRALCTGVVIALTVSAAAPSRGADAPTAGRMLVLGIDGMDPGLLRTLIDAGDMPHFARLTAAGSFQPLETSVPPQSPVAWSNVISGAHPGVHQIYDFIHRDPRPGPSHGAILPYLSTSRVFPPESDRGLALGGWRIPLSGGSIRSLRRGPAFWDALVAHGVETAVYRIPANYPPPAGTRCACLTGMGTPDLLGTYGMFTLFTPDAPPEGREVSGGRFVHWSPTAHRVTGTLQGPPNYLRRPDAAGRAPAMTLDFTVVRDPDADVAKIEIQEQVVLLAAGEWSGWVPVRFETGMPGSTILGALSAPVSVPCMVRFYLRSTHPKLEMYVSPLNIDPMTPANPISTPAGFSRELAEETGRFYTTGIPQDTKALRQHALDEDEFLAQCRLVLDERIAQYRAALDRFDAGCLFFYFGAVDQLSHIFWRDRDAGHPGRIAAQAERYAGVIDDVYREMDGLVGEALAALDDDDTILIVSDHGFTSFRRGFNLNTWLERNGYLVPARGDSAVAGDMFADVNWSATRAYGLGLNGLYINLRGREHYGIVNPDEDYDSLLGELTEALLAVRDEDGAPVIERVYRVAEIYAGADLGIAPDLIVGYGPGYRASWATALGGRGDALIEDNLDRWSGDHCTAHDVVPGIIVTNRTLARESPTLSDIAPTVLNVFGVAAPPEMTGRPLFAVERP